MDDVARLLSLAAATFLLLVLPGSSGSATTDGRIVFQATPAGSFSAQLFSIAPTGDGLKQLTTGSNAAIDPAFSPTGQRIAFARFGVGLFTMNRDGSGLKRLTKSGRDASPAWSPNGTRIAFVRPIGPKWHLFVVSASGGKAKLLPQTPPAGKPSWTKAGLLIPTGGDLLRVDPKNGRVLKYYGATIDAIWGLNSVAISPSLSILTYIGSREPESGDMDCGDGPCQRFGLYQESLTTKKKRPHMIVKNTGPAAFSPDGKRMVYAADGGLALRSVSTGASTTIDTGDVTPTTAAPPTWR
jgi:hypothetical protein